jgi:hypothetical protein
LDKRSPTNVGNGGYFPVFGKGFFDLINATNCKSEYSGGSVFFSQLAKIAATKMQIDSISGIGIYRIYDCSGQNTFDF